MSKRYNKKSYKTSNYSNKSESFVPVFLTMLLRTAAYFFVGKYKYSNPFYPDDLLLAIAIDNILTLLIGGSIHTFAFKETGKMHSRNRYKMKLNYWTTYTMGSFGVMILIDIVSWIVYGLIWLFTAVQLFAGNGLEIIRLIYMWPERRLEVILRAIILLEPLSSLKESVKISLFYFLRF